MTRVWIFGGAFVALSLAIVTLGVWVGPAAAAVGVVFCVLAGLPTAVLVLASGHKKMKGETP